jgi:hypothetical protein
VRRALLLAGCVLLAAACGGGGHRLSKEDYAKRADTVCTRFSRQTKSLGGATNLKQLARLADKTLPLLDSAVADIRKLSPPKDEQETANRWLATLDRLRTDVVKIRERARANDLAGVQAVLPAATRDDSESNRLAGQLGTKVCKRPS